LYALGKPARACRPYKTAVVGVGNILMGDEGIGVRIVQALEQEPLPEGAALFDGGTAFHELIGELAVFQKWIIVDAVNGGEPPGAIYRLELQEILDGIRQNAGSSDPGSVQNLGPVSLHDIGVIEALMLERFVDSYSSRPRFLDVTEVVILGIEPESVELSLELSPTLERLLPLLLQAVRDELLRTPSPPPGRQGVHPLCKEEPT
jgi:hydrogenase maturation protease